MGKEAMTNPVDKLRALAEAATPGPITPERDPTGINRPWLHGADPGDYAALACGATPEGAAINAQFLSASANLVRRMLSDEGREAVVNALDLLTEPGEHTLGELADAAIAALIGGGQ